MAQPLGRKGRLQPFNPVAARQGPRLPREETEAREREEPVPLAPVATPPKDLLTVEDVAQRTSLPVSTVWRLLARGELRSLKVSRRRLIPVEWLEEWRQARMRAAADGGKEGSA